MTDEELLDVRFEMRANKSWVDRVDAWRRTQPGSIPSRAEAIRRLTEVALSGTHISICVGEDWKSFERIAGGDLRIVPKISETLMMHGHTLKILDVINDLSGDLTHHSVLILASTGDAKKDAAFVELALQRAGRA